MSLPKEELGCMYFLILSLLGIGSINSSLGNSFLRNKGGKLSRENITLD